jgi:tRNA(fMet)-specific endonuclease VapC
MTFLLDTDTLSFWLRGEGGVAERLASLRPSDVCTSSIVLGEVELGLRRRRSRKLRRLVDAIFAELVVAPYDATAALRYGEIAAELLDEGVPIGVEDTMIAAHALSLNLTLVTHNVRHYERIKRLRVEDWHQAGI